MGTRVSALGPLVNVEAKVALRRALRAERAALDDGLRQREEAACVEALVSLVDGVEHVASYAAAGSELSLDGLHLRLWSRGRSLWLPRVEGRELTWCRVDKAGELRPGYRGIREPTSSEACRALPEGCLVLVPGLAFDARGRRLGQGGGFYDRALGGRHHLRTVGVGFGCQARGEIPFADHDVHLDGVLLGGTWVRPLSAAEP